MIQNYLNAKIFSESETTDQTFINSKKFAQNANLLNQQSQIPLQFNVVMSNLAALAGARNMFNLSNPVTQQIKASTLSDPQVILNEKYLPTSLKAVHQFNTNMQAQLFHQKSCRSNENYQKTVASTEEENFDYLHKKSSPLQADILKKDLIDS